MSQTFTSTDVVSTTNVFSDNQSQRTNENTLRSTFSGSTQPSDPVVGQQWYDTANSKTMQYNGTTWVPVDTNGTTQVDVNNAKGSLTSLTSYLRVAHNDDGTLKTTPASSIDEFKDNALVITYLSPTRFRVPSDLTSIFTANRKLKIYLSASTVITYVSSSTYDSGNSWTVVTIGGSVLDSSVTTVKYSIVQYGEREDTVHTGDLSTYAPLTSPALTGTPTVDTQNLQGNQAGSVTYTAAATLTSSDCGKLIICNSSSPFTLTVPTTLSAHMVLHVYNAGTGAVTLYGGTFYGSSISNSVTINQYSTVVYTCDGTYWYSKNSSLSLGIAIVNETEPSGTRGGTFTSGAWRTRVLNTIVTDTIGISLSNNQITIPAGTYIINADAPAFAVGFHKIRLENMSTASTIQYGSSEISGNSDNTATRSYLSSYFTATSPTVIELQHQCTTTYGAGFGLETSLGPEIYSRITIERVG